jgi:hypothetical protein
MREMLLDRETSYAAALELRPGRVGAEQLALDVDREIADPACPNSSIVAASSRIGSSGWLASVFTATRGASALRGWFDSAVPLMPRLTPKR